MRLMEFPKIILATTSRTRLEAFRTAGINFVAEASDVDEMFKDRPERPGTLVELLARKKAEAVWENHRGEDCVVFGFDSVGYHVESNSILEKPKTREEAFDRIKMLSGNSGYAMPHKFLTGIHMIRNRPGEEPLVKQDSSVTVVSMRRSITAEEINFYLDQGEGYKQLALGYNPTRGYSSTFIKEISGSLCNLVYGVSIAKVLKMMRQTS